MYVWKDVNMGEDGEMGIRGRQWVYVGEIRWVYIGEMGNGSVWEEVGYMERWEYEMGVHGRDGCMRGEMGGCGGGGYMWEVGIHVPKY